MVQAACCDNSGGRVTLTVNGVRYSTRSGITIMPSTFERSAEANDDGSIYVTTKPMPAEAEFTLSDRCGLTIADLDQCHIDATFDFIDMRRQYLFTKATVVGRPSIKSDTGEISGLKIVSSLVKQVEY